MILALVLPGMIAAQSVPPEAGRILNYRSTSDNCDSQLPSNVPTDWTLVVCDTFDDNANGWLMGDETDDFARGYRALVDGSYVWRMEATQDVVSFVWMRNRTFSDLYLAADAAWVDVPPDAVEYGLQFRQLDDNNFYLFTVDAVARRYSLLILDQGQWETLIDSTEHPVIRQNDANRLAVLAQGSSFTLFINGQEVAQYEDSRIAEGQVGLTATYEQGDRIRLAFDNFVVRVPSDKREALPTAAALPVSTSPVLRLQPTVDEVCNHGQWLVDRGWTRVVCDDFSSNANGWPVGAYEDSYAKVDRTIENQLYKWRMEPNNSAANWAVLRGQTFTDVWVSTLAMMTSETQSGDYGLVFRKVDNENYYRFSVAETGHYRVDIYYQGQWASLIDWSPSDAIQVDGANDIAVLAEQSTFTFYINGQQVNRLDDSRLTQGEIGLAMEAYAGETATLQFLNFEVITPATQGPTPPSPIVTLAPAECDIPAGAPPNWSIALCDQFLDNRSGWPLGVDTAGGNRATFDVAAGTYGFSIEAAQDAFVWKPYDAQSFSDFYTAMSANIYSGKPETSYELVFRAVDDDNHYTFSAAGGYFQVALLYQNRWQELIPWTFSSALRVGDFNQLAVLAQGPSLTFYINGEQVGNVTDNTIPAGKIGLGATVYQGDQASIQFDSILIMVPPGLVQPTLPPPPPARPTLALPPPARPTAGQPDVRPTTVPISEACGPVAVQDLRAWPVQVCETFDNNELGWDDGQRADDLGVVWRSIEDGAYRWRVQAARDLVYVARYAEAPWLRNFYIAVDAGRSDGPEDTEYGLQFGRTTGDHWGIFSVTDAGVFGEGQFNVEMYHEGQWEVLVDWTDSDAIRPGQSNRLAIKGVGASLWFYINGQQVAQLEEPRLSEGAVGVFIAAEEMDEATFRFDNFELRVPPEELALLEPHVPVQPISTAALPLATQSAPDSSLSGTLTPLPWYGNCAPPLNAPSGWVRAFCDPFDDDSNHWRTGGEIGKDVDVQDVIEGGVYRWHIQAHEGSSVWGIGEGSTYSDLHVAVDIPYSEGPENDAVGLVFRGQDIDNCYIFVVDVGSFLLIAAVDGNLEALIDWTEAPALRVGQSNHLEVTAIGSNITLYINGEQVGRVRDNRLKDGLVGLVALLGEGDQLYVEFDNLQILVPQT